MCFRYGGEEFAVILPSTDKKGAFQILDHLRKAVEVLEIPHNNSEIDKIVTISIGCSTINPTTDGNIEDFLSDADQYLYTAKHKGRNQVVSKYKNN